MNFKRFTVSHGRGSKKWIKDLVEKCFKLFKTKSISTNLIESKHHEIKSKGITRMRRDPNYSDKLYKLFHMIDKQGVLPMTLLKTKILFKNLNIPKKRERKKGLL